MFRQINRYKNIYFEFLKNSISQSTSFRAHFVLLILVDLVFYLTSLFTIDFIFQYSGHIGEWNRSQFLFFASFMLIIDHLHMTFFSESFWEFSFSIRTGNLDFVLLKPISALFSLFFRYFRPASLFNFIVPWSSMIYFGIEAELSLISWLSIPFLALLGLTLILSIEILVSMLNFLTVEGYGVNFLRMQIQAMSRWPDFVFNYLSRKIFTLLIPVLMVGSYPIRFIFDNSRWMDLVYLIGTTGIIWILIQFTWKLGLRYYESASS